jgi:AraC-like DNA-binding protein
MGAHRKFACPLVKKDAQVVASNAAGATERASAVELQTQGSNGCCLVYSYGDLFLWNSDEGAVLLDGNNFLLTDFARWDRFRNDNDLPSAAMVWLSGRGLLPQPELAARGAGDAVGAVSPALRALLYGWRRAASVDAHSLAAARFVRAIVDEVARTRVRTGRRQSRLVQDAKQRLHGDPARRFTLDEVSATLGVSAGSLTQAFKRSEGLPFYRYQLEISVGEAMRRLPACEDITSLAFELGYSSHSHFSTTFKKSTGMSPSEFRDAYSEENDQLGLVANKRVAVQQHVS